MPKKTSIRWLEIGVALVLAVQWSGVAQSNPFSPNPDFIDRGAYRGDYRLKLDSNFTVGQEIYLGRSKAVRGLKICVRVESADDESEEPKIAPVSRKLMRSFKGHRVTELTTRLVDCAEPEKHIALVLDRPEFRALIHFINKRFRLVLEES